MTVLALMTSNSSANGILALPDTRKTLKPLASKLPPPLGQGIANAVGLAMAEAHLAARFNKSDAAIVDHYTYAILGDGCNMEGVSGEACSSPDT